MLRWLHKELPHVMTMPNYDSDKTPFDDFDNDCHKQIINSKKDLTDEQLLFMVNTAEQVGRPEDMLMFLGEYFKVLISRTSTIEKQIAQKAQGYASKVQQEFFLTMDVLNSLASACKMYIDPPRQELRIAIALARNPLFKDDQLSTLHNSIRRAQKTII